MRDESSVVKLGSIYALNIEASVTHKIHNLSVDAVL